MTVCHLSNDAFLKGIAGARSYRYLFCISASFQLRFPVAAGLTGQIMDCSEICPELNVATWTKLMLGEK